MEDSLSTSGLEVGGQGEERSDILRGQIVQGE
jgi:hypothetical protein